MRYKVVQANPDGSEPTLPAVKAGQYFTSANVQSTTEDGDGWYIYEGERTIPQSYGNDLSIAYLNFRSQQNFPQTQWKVGDYLLIDYIRYERSSEQVTAHQATLQNFSAEQVVGGNQQAYLDFYSKLPYLPFAQKFNGVDQYADAEVNPNINATIEYNLDWCFSAWMMIPTSGVHFIGGHSHPTTNYNQGVFFNTYLGYIELQIQKHAEIVRLCEYEVGVPFLLTFNHYSDDTFKVYKNGEEVPHSFRVPRTINSSLYTNNEATWTFGARLNNQNDNTFYGEVWYNHVVVFKTTLNADQARTLHKHRGAPLAELHSSVVAHYVADSQGLLMPDRVADYNYAKTAALTPYPASLVGFTQPDVVEALSLLPPHVNALKFNRQSQFGLIENVRPTNEQGYTFMICWHIDQPRDFYRDAVFQYYQDAFELDTNLCLQRDEAHLRCQHQRCSPYPSP